MERKNSHQVNHDQKSLPSKTECLMKFVSGSFGIVVYNVHKHIRAEENFDVWTLHHQTWHCSCTCFQAKDLVPASVSLCCRFQNSKLKLVEDNQKFTSHTHQLPQHRVRPVCQYHDAEENGHKLLPFAHPAGSC